MKPSPLRGKLAAALMTNGDVSATAETAERIVDIVLDLVAEATPAEITEEGTYLLGASHLWSETQGSKATAFLVRRITAADQVVRSRLEREVESLKERVAALQLAGESDFNDLERRLMGHSWSSKAVMNEVLTVMRQED